MYIAAVIIGIVIAALIALQLYRLVKGYRKATGTRWQRFLAAFSDSLTILWARVVTIVGAVSAYIINFLPAIDPTTSLGSTIATVLKPEYAPYYAIGIGVLFEIVRRRPGSVSPILPPAQSQP